MASRALTRAVSRRDHARSQRSGTVLAEEQETRSGCACRSLAERVTQHENTKEDPGLNPARGNDRAIASIQADAPRPPRATVRARIPRVARSAPSDRTGKIPASFQAGSMDDQS